MEDEDEGDEDSNEDDEDAQIRSGGQDLAAVLLKSLGLPPLGAEDDAENDNEEDEETAVASSNPTG